MGYTRRMRVEKTAEYREWLDALRDRSGRARILVRVDRLIDGNPGQHRNLPDGVSELKIDFGPGYRVYYTQRGMRLVLLLVGGDKSTQQVDIATAIKLARDFKE
jgi:putative addiction module killer protein